jgi:hypothetical protein
MTSPLPIGVVIRAIGADPATRLESARRLDDTGRSEYADAVVETIGGRGVVIVAESMGRFTAPIVRTRQGAEAMRSYEDDIALFYQDVPQELASEGPKRGRRKSEARLVEPSTLVFCLDVHLRVRPCRDDRLFSAALVRRVARERLEITSDEINGGRSPTLSRPKALAERLEAYAAATGASSG